ncbi:hypothetical protein scyTo_0001355 [Scyliorhinus torazame]|uniref:Uncharacterized protein n=1 Tax=Scyliorhinus torazame TaxID=75743 RepID=A0A401PC77_SCYTO|nr:hypothetical protein [Scyliorhinus torazame]
MSRAPKIDSKGTVLRLEEKPFLEMQYLRFRAGKTGIVLRQPHEQDNEGGVKADGGNWIQCHEEVKDKKR